MTTDDDVRLPAALRVTRRFTPARYVIRVGTNWSPVRAATVLPIADALEADCAFAATLDASATSAAARTVLDLVDSGMIAPPRPRRRRERPVSSRAVFYQAADA